MGLPSKTSVWTPSSTSFFPSSNQNQPESKGPRYNPQGELMEECLNPGGFGGEYWRVYFGPNKHTWQTDPDISYGQGQFINGKPHGVWSFCFENGQPHSSGHYTFGQPDQYWTYFTRDGQVKTQGYYADDFKVGDWF